MEKIEELSKKLTRFNESYEIDKNQIIVKTDSPLYIYIRFEQDGYEIEGKLMQ